MTDAMKREMLVNPGPQSPDPQIAVCIIWIPDIAKNIIIRLCLPAITQQLCSLWSNIKIFMSSGFLLSECEPRSPSEN